MMIDDEWEWMGDDIDVGGEGIHVYGRGVEMDNNNNHVFLRVEDDENSRG